MRKGMTSRKIKAGKRAQVLVEKLYFARSHDPSTSLRMYTCIDLFIHTRDCSTETWNAKDTGRWPLAHSFHHSRTASITYAVGCLPLRSL
jgi:hypothetical protein